MKRTQDHNCNREGAVPRFSVWPGRASLVLCPLALSGCGPFRVPSSQSAAEVGPFRFDTNKVNSVTLGALQTQVLRFADQYVAMPAQATEELSAKA